MKVRTCPYCNYQYSRLEYLKNMFVKFSYSEWDCKNCKKEITFSIKTRLLTALFIVFWVFLMSNVKSYLEMNLLLWIIFVVIFMLGQFLIFTFDTFKKTHK